ncbi:hypothetical protein WJX72_000347 [[Myrmecia] bisecta]|uniref:Uncharacterized protein n=1 Tax=[Myrmecia] bisecta TaxID=41462 RepID=A0AAW1QE13_9CHLO
MCVTASSQCRTAVAGPRQLCAPTRAHLRWQFGSALSSGLLGKHQCATPSTRQTQIRTATRGASEPVDPESWQRSIGDAFKQQLEAEALAAHEAWLDNTVETRDSKLKQLFQLAYQARLAYDERLAGARESGISDALSPKEMAQAGALCFYEESLKQLVGDLDMSKPEKSRYAPFSVDQSLEPERFSAMQISTMLQQYSSIRHVRLLPDADAFADDIWQCTIGHRGLSAACCSKLERDDRLFGIWLAASALRCVDMTVLSAPEVQLADNKRLGQASDAESQPGTLGDGPSSLPGAISLTWMTICSEPGSTQSSIQHM